MRLGLRVFFAFFLIAGLSSFALLRVVLTEVKPSVREVMEDLMVDSANLLAELVRDELANLPSGATLADSPLAEQVRAYARRPLDVQIWGLRKQRLDLRVTITDAQGRVLLDSGPGQTLGADHSRWRDVALTLRGEYGARATPNTYGDDRSTVLHVAAPVRQGERLLGVVSVAKPVASIQPFIDRAERRILIAGLALLTFSLALGVGVTLWLVFSVRRLRDYAQRVQAGGRRQPPPPVPGELGELAQAMDAMRERLDGREHIEHTVRALTHELKSPLAALRGAGELLHDELAAADRQRFAGQVVAQSERLSELVERLLELSKLELLPAPAHLATLRLDLALDQALGRLVERLRQQDLTPVWLQREPLPVPADPELLDLALNNLLGNALDFAPPGSALELSVRPAAEGRWALLELRDQGPGVPAAALPQLGQRFFSTARPGSLKKGSGLGLAIVRRVAELHGGRLEFEAADPGLRVRLALPLA